MLLVDAILKQFLKKPGFFIKSLTFFKPVYLIEPRVPVHHHESHFLSFLHLGNPFNRLIMLSNG